jgi:hypothetical protein
MTRQIITRRDAAERTAATREQPGVEAHTLPDDYLSRIVKYVPVEVITLFALVNGAIQQSSSQGPHAVLLWIVFVVIAALTPLYLWRVQKVTKVVQLAVSTVAFGVWVFYIGGPFALCTWYQPLYGVVVLPLFTFAIGLIEPEA